MKNKFIVYWKASIPRFYMEDSEEYQSGLDHYQESVKTKSIEFDSVDNLKRWVEDQSVDYGEQGGAFKIIKILKNGKVFPERKLWH